MKCHLLIENKIMFINQLFKILYLKIYLKYLFLQFSQIFIIGIENMVNIKKSRIRFLTILK